MGEHSSTQSQHTQQGYEAQTTKLQLKPETAGDGNKHDDKTQNWYDWTQRVPWLIHSCADDCNFRRVGWSKKQKQNNKKTKNKQGARNIRIWNRKRKMTLTREHKEFRNTCRVQCVVSGLYKAGLVWHQVETIMQSMEKEQKLPSFNSRVLNITTLFFFFYQILIVFKSNL